MFTRKWRLAFKIVFAVFIAILGVVFIRNLIDFPVYYAAGQSLLKGRTDLYAPDFALGRVMDYRYPPFFLLALTPLWLLPYKPAAYLWYLLSILEIAGSLFFLNNLLKPLVPSKVAWMVITLAVLQYFVIILHYGNAHLLVTFLVFGSLFYGLRQSETRAAALMALAISIKLTPAFLLLYFLLKRRWKFLGLVCALVLAINTLPMVYFGIDQNTELLKNWYQHVIVNQEFHEVNGPINLSFKGQLRRYFTTINYQERVDGDTKYPPVNIASYPGKQVDQIWLLVSGCLVGLVSFLLYKRRSKEGGPKRVDPSEQIPKKAIKKSPEAIPKNLVELGLLISVMLFVEPLTSKIYFIALLWPVFVLAVLVFEKSTGEDRLFRRVLILIAILNFGLPLLPGRSIQRWLLVLGADFYVNLLVLVAQIYYLMVLRKRHQLTTDEPQRPVR
jgi:hypothetical protein